jgi:hypothetical protein
MVKKQSQNSKFIPIKYLFDMDGTNSIVVDKLIALQQANNIKGDISWNQLKQLDPSLEKEVRGLVNRNTLDIDNTYNSKGADKQILKQNRMKKSNVQNQNQTNSKKSTYRIKPLKQKIQEAKALLKEPIKALNAQKILAILSYADLEYDQIKDYYLRLKEIQLKPKYTVKPDYIDTNRKLLTTNFGDKAKPEKWIDNDPIIKSKLYSAKMAIQYLKEADKEVLDETMKIVKPKLDEVLKALGFSDINDITF